MSYLDLCDKFKEVKEHWLETKSICEEYVRFLNEKSALDRNYSKGLKRLTKLELFNHGSGSLSSCLETIKSVCKQNSKQVKELAENLQKDLVINLKQMILHQDLLIKDKMEIGKRLVSEREKTIKSHDRAKERYFKEIKDAEISAKSKFNSGLKLEETYKIEIEALNSNNKLYIEGMRKVLFVFQTQEEERMKNLKDSLRKMVVYEISNLRSLQYELDTLPNVFYKLDNGKLQSTIWSEKICRRKYYSHRDRNSKIHALSSPYS